MPTANAVLTTQAQVIGVHYWCFGIGGGEKVSQVLVNYLAAQGYRVLLYTDVAPTSQDLPLPPEITRKTVPQALEERAAFWAHEAQTEQLSCLIYSTPLSPTGASDIAQCKAAGLRVICVTHCSSAYPADKNNGPELFFRLRSCISAADALICLSAVDALFWEAYNPASFAVLNPVSDYLDSRAHEPRERRGQELLWCGRLDPVEKRPHVALQVFAQVQAELPDAHLTLVGGGNSNYLSELKALAQSLGIANSVSFTGAQPDPSAYFAQADVFLSTSPSEGFPITYIEASQAALPIACFNQPGLTLLRACPAIRTAPWGNTSELAKQVVELLRTPHFHSVSAKLAACYEQLYQVSALERWGAIIDAVVHDRPLTSPDFTHELAQALPPALQPLLDPHTPETKRLAHELFASAYERLMADKREEIAALIGSKDAQATEIEQLKAQLVAKDQELSDVWNSLSMRLGRALTSIPRKLRGTTDTTRR